MKRDSQADMSSSKGSSAAAPRQQMERNSQDSSPRPLCVRVPTAARMLGIGLTKMYALIGAGEVQTIRLGRVTLITIASLERLIERHVSES